MKSRNFVNRWYASFILPTEYLGAIMQLAEGRRGRYKSTEYLSEKRAILIYELPLAEIIFDFFDKMKSATRGYGTLDYDFIGYEASDLVKLDILVREACRRPFDDSSQERC